MGRTLRWRVAIVDDHERSRADLRAAIWAAGGEVAGEAVRRADATALVERARPDVAIFAVGLSDGDGLEAAADVVAQGCPVVLFTSHTDPALVARAQQAGVMGYLLKPLRPAELAPALDLAMRRYGLSEPDAFHRLRRAAMDARRPMAEIARAVLTSEAVAGKSEAQ